MKGIAYTLLAILFIEHVHKWRIYNAIKLSKKVTSSDQSSHFFLQNFEILWANDKHLGHWEILGILGSYQSFFLVASRATSHRSFSNGK